MNLQIVTIVLLQLNIVLKQLVNKQIPGFVNNPIMLNISRFVMISILNISIISLELFPYDIDIFFHLTNEVKAAEFQDEEVSDLIASSANTTLLIIDNTDFVLEGSFKERVHEYLLTGQFHGPSAEERYRKLAGVHFYDNVLPYIDIIDKVLKEKGYEEDALLIQTMFYIGQHESHWTPTTVSGFVVGSEHPTGIFQFLPSTFRSVSNGNIFDLEDQIRAFIEMVERGRVDEYQTLFVCGYAPCLSAEAKGYVLSIN